MKLMSVREVSDLLKVKPHRIYEMVREGLLPGVRLGRQVRISEDALRRWIQNGGQALPGGWKRESNQGGGYVDTT